MLYNERKLLPISAPVHPFRMQASGKAGTKAKLSNTLVPIFTISIFHQETCCLPHGVGWKWEKGKVLCKGTWQIMYFIREW